VCWLKEGGNQRRVWKKLLILTLENGKKTKKRAQYFSLLLSSLLLHNAPLGITRISGALLLLLGLHKEHKSKES